MSNENDSEDPAGLEEPSFASYESRGTPPHYHDVLSSADFGDAGYPFGVNPAILGPDHFVTNIPDPNLCQTLCTKDGPINTLRKNSRGEKHKRIFQACTRCRDRKAKVCGSSTHHVHKDNANRYRDVSSAMGLSPCAWLAGFVERSVCMLAGACEGLARSAFWKTRISLPDVVEELQGSQCLNNRCRRIVPRPLNKVQRFSEKQFCSHRIMEYFLNLLPILRPTLLHRHLCTAAALPKSQGLQTTSIALSHRSELLKESISMHTNRIRPVRLRHPI